MSDSFGVGNDNNESFAMRYFLNGVEKSKDEYFNEFKKAYEKVTKS